MDRGRVLGPRRNWEQHVMARSDASAIALLGAAARILNQSGDHAEIIGQALNLACQGLSCRGLAFYQKYFSGVGTFELRCLGRCQHSQEPMETAQLDRDQWHSPKNGDPVELVSNGGPDYVLLPVPLDKYLFGFLAVQGMAAGGLEGEDGDFLKALQALLTMWVSKSDLAKKVDDILAQVPIPTMIEDTEGFISAWNPAMAQRTGWQADRILGKGNHIHSVPFYYQRRPHGQ